MLTLSYNIVILPTYDLYTLAVKDNSTYPDDPPVVIDPIMEIVVPGFDTVYLPFVVEETNIYNSTDLGITTAGNEEPLPDGIYCFKYTVDATVVVDKSILRVERLQEKFDKAFMQLDMMECDRAIKTQSKVDLMTIYFFIQGAIAAANNCMTVQATKLYQKANSMLDGFVNNNCNCSGNNYVINFQ